MSIEVNTVLLAGNIASDIDLHYTTNETPVANFRLAVNSGYGDKKKTLFIDVAVFGKTAENVNKYCSKGSSVLVEGRLEEDTWETTEGKRFKHFVTARFVHFLGVKQPQADSEI